MKTAVQFTIYLNESDRWHNRPLHVEILQMLRAEGIAGASAFHAVAGFNGRSPVHTFARTQNTPVLHALQPENEVWLNDGAAEKLGLRDGDRVWLENQDGARSGPVRVKATPRIRTDCVFMVHGFGHQAAGLTRANGKGASDTRLQTRYVLDRISGGAGLRVNFVKLVREA